MIIGVVFDLDRLHSHLLWHCLFSGRTQQAHAVSICWPKAVPNILDFELLSQVAGPLLYSNTPWLCFRQYCRTLQCTNYNHDGGFI